MAERVRLRWRGDLAGAFAEVRDGVHSPLERRYRDYGTCVELDGLMARG